MYAPKFTHSLACIVATTVASCGGQGTVSRDVPFEDTVPFSETPVGQHGALSVEAGQLVDVAGEPIQLRGVSSMWLNWENSGYATNLSGLKWMRDNWNIQVFRAAMGVTGGDRRPVSNGYLGNALFMESQVSTIVENAERLGLYVIIDWHDHYAQDNVDRAQEFFAKMAEKYGHLPNVIYEPYNEPLTAEANGVGPFTWDDDLKPYHEAVLASIREHDADNVAILGTPNWSQFVDEAALNPVAGANLLYTLHFYTCTHEEWLRERARVALDSGIGLFVTEWAATDASGGAGDATLCTDEADTWLDFLEQRGVSWVAWKLDDCTDGSCLLRPSAPVDGDFDGWLQGHGPYIAQQLTAERSWLAPSGVGRDAAGDSVDAGAGAGGAGDAGLIDGDASD